MNRALAGRRQNARGGLIRRTLQAGTRGGWVCGEYPQDCLLVGSQRVRYLDASHRSGSPVADGRSGGIVAHKKPFVTKEQAEAIASHHPTPFYLYDEAGIRANAQRLLDAFSWNAGFREYFAVKSTPNPALIGILQETGMLCENSDRLANDRALPEVQVGDLLFIHDCGAHGHSMGYNYDGRLCSAELLLCEDGTVRQIRCAETPADYFATLDVLPLGERLKRKRP